MPLKNSAAKLKGSRRTPTAQSISISKARRRGGCRSLSGRLLRGPPTYYCNRWAYGPEKFGSIERAELFNGIGAFATSRDSSRVTASEPEAEARGCHQA
jgi:hypothetical protein